MKFFCAYPLFHRGNIIQKCQSERFKKVLKRRTAKVCFLKKGGLNLRAMHLQENHKLTQLFEAVLQNKCS